MSKQSKSCWRAITRSAYHLWLLKSIFLKNGAPSMLTFTFIFNPPKLLFLRYARTGGHPTTWFLFPASVSSPEISKNVLFLPFFSASPPPGSPSLSSVSSPKQHLSIFRIFVCADKVFDKMIELKMMRNWLYIHAEKRKQCQLLVCMWETNGGEMFAA